jgi:tRNA-splicing ligase RtcB
MTNRREMMRLILDVIARYLPPFAITKEAINCHHNYVAQEDHFGASVYVTRKGAIRAGDGELGIIPGSMGAKSYIVRGKGNAESFCSCSHGAGRRMSRTKAKKAFSQSDLTQQTEGVECRKDSGVIDEIPGAYKDIDEVMNNQSDLVDVVHTLKQVLCVKG